MAEFSEFLHKLKPLSEMDVNMEQLKQLPQPNPSLSESFSASDFSVDSFLTYQLHQQQQQQQEPEISQSYYNEHDQLSTFSSGMFLSSSPGVHTMISSNQIGLPENKKRKAIEQSSTCCSSKDITPPASVANASEKNKVRICKKGKIKHVEIRAEEVIHVRAKRGQATDSHSIAERVRREKINNKLRCLQDLVPGCHKSMGMAVMLEEIINYVHSLQNQVEFLSMELAAASSSYGLNLERLKRPQGTNPGDEQEMQKWRRQQFGEINCFHSTWSI